MSNQMDPEALSPDLINAIIHFTRIPHARRALYKLLNDPSFVHTGKHPYTQTYYFQLLT